MIRIIKMIEEKKLALTEGKLFKWLSNDAISGHERLSFSPAMLYYLMGFKDVLGHLFRKNPQSKLDTYINAYCGEDAEHWRWYLRDLEKLGYSLNTWGNTISQWCNNVWSPDLDANRQTIFKLINFTKLSNDPLFAITLIMIFEATGVVFIGHTRKAAIAIDMDNNLKYFGKTHYMEEFGHSVQNKDFEDFVMSNETFSLAVPMINELFSEYDKLFDCWYENRSCVPKYIKTQSELSQ